MNIVNTTWTELSHKGINDAMKMRCVVSLLIFFGLFFTCLNGICGAKEMATVLYCYDGDTCRVKTDGGLWFNVRLFGIDAQEMARKRKKRRPGQPFAESAKNALNDKAKGKSVRLNQVDLDGYNRPVVEVWLNGRDINLEMVAEGWTEAYKGKTKRISMVPYLQAEKKAQEKKLGIWELKNYKSPREFRKRKNK